MSETAIGDIEIMSQGGDESPDGEDIASHAVAKPRRRTSAVRAAASRANARKSTGPRTEVGKLRSSRNALKQRSTRLLGEVESRLLGQAPGSAEELYRELIRPYERLGEPAPPMLAMHFHDLARLRLELETWERIRDAQIEERWRQSDIELRRRLHKLQHDLPKTAEEVFEKGLAGLDESPARLRQQVQCLYLLRGHLERRDFDFEPILQKLYGKDLNPGSDRAEIICMRCERLMHPEEREPLTDEEYEDLIGLIALEQRDATTAYGLYLDDAGMPAPARLARLGPTEEHRAMSLEGERLRNAIDRKQWVITGLLQTLGLHRREHPAETMSQAEKGAPPPPIFRKNEADK